MPSKAPMLKPWSLVHLCSERGLCKVIGSWGLWLHEWIDPLINLWLKRLWRVKFSLLLPLLPVQHQVNNVSTTRSCCRDALLPDWPTVNQSLWSQESQYSHPPLKLLSLGDLSAWFHNLNNSAFLCWVVSGRILWVSSTRIQMRCTFPDHLPCGRCGPPRYVKVGASWILVSIVTILPKAIRWYRGKHCFGVFSPISVGPVTFRSVISLYATARIQSLACLMTSNEREIEVLTFLLRAHSQWPNILPLDATSSKFYHLLSRLETTL